MKRKKRSLPEPNNKVSSFRLSDEARAEIDNEYADVSEEYLASLVYPDEDGDIYDDAEEYEDTDEEEADEDTDEEDEFGEDEDETDDEDADVDDIDEEDANEEYTDDEDADEADEVIPCRPKRHILRKLIIAVIILCFAVMFFDICVLFYTGQLWFNQPRKRDYPVRGPVITEKLGEIGWTPFSRQNIQMCYIRATKSIAYEDERFSENKDGSRRSRLPTGMIHIFDPDRSGKEQAEHFIEVCGKMKGRLRPAVDCDPGIFRTVIPPDYDKFTNELRDFCDCIKEEYGCTPIIKCSSRIYNNVAQRDTFEDCPIWYISEYSKPPDDVRWDFWGYSSRVKFDYYESKDFLEMVLFNGDEKQFKKMYI